MIIRDIDNLDYHTLRILASFWNRFRDESSIPSNMTTTIYHLRFSEEQGLIHIYVYRSVKNFVSETLPYGIIVKPECHPPENPIFPNDFKKMMEEQRDIQKSFPKENRGYIGGKIQIHHLTKDGISVYTLDQFDDFEWTQQEIYNNYGAWKSESPG